MTIKITKKIVSFLGVTVLAATLLLLPLVVAHAQGTGPPDITTPADTVWESCGLSDFGSCLQWFGIWMVEKLSLGLLTIGAWILWLGGVVLDEVLRYTVVEMSTRIGEGGLQTMINEVWRVARDFSNMFFVFILLYGAIVTVLGRDDINVRKVIRNVVIVAILINFSLLFTKIIIDVSNATTVVFYNRILQDVPAGSVESGGISVAFMNRFGLTSLWDPSTAERVLNSNAGGSAFKFFMLGLFGLVFMSVAAFVFFAIAMLFITRYLTLLFLLVLSPLAFAAMALPKDKYSDDWKKALMNQAIFAPVCMAMLWISLRILSVVVATPPDLGGVFIAAAGSVGTDAGNPAVSILNFIIAIGSIIAVLIVAQKTGAKGADGWLKRGKKIRGNIQGFFGRNTIGRAATNIDKSLAGTRIGNTQFGRAIRASTVGELKKSGFGSKISFDKAQKQREKDDIAYANRRLDDREKKEKGYLESQLKSLGSKQYIASSDAEVKGFEENISRLEADKARYEEVAHRTGVDETERTIALKKLSEVEAKITDQQSKLKRAQAISQQINVAAKVREGGESSLTDSERKSFGELKTRIIKEDIEPRREKEYAALERRKGGIVGGAVVGGVIGSVAGPIGTIAGATSGAIIKKALNKWGNENIAATSRVVTSAVTGAVAGAIAGSAIPGIGSALGSIAGGVEGLRRGYTKRNELAPQAKVVVEVLRSGKKKKDKKPVTVDALKELGIDVEGGGEEKKEGGGDKKEGGGEAKK